jgi:hypothetical protein
MLCDINNNITGIFASCRDISAQVKNYRRLIIMSKDTQQLVDALQSQGNDIACEDLIALFDKAVLDKRIDTADAAKELGVLNARSLNDMFNDFTAKKVQFNCPLTTKETPYPELDPKVKQAMVVQLNKAYQL